METGTKVYRCEIYTTGALDGQCVRYYISEATATGIEVDGVEMAKAHNVLLPIRDYVASEQEAKRVAADKLRAFVADVQKTIEELSA